MVLDTTVLIDVLRGFEPAVAYLTRLDDVPVCSEITRVEVMRGLRSGERQGAEHLTASLDWHPVDESIARRAGELGRAWRRSHLFATADLIIAATADLAGLPLATSNVRHFPMFRDLLPPYSD